MLLDDECPDTDEGEGVCWHNSVGCDKTTKDPTDKLIDGMCGFIHPGGGGSSIGSFCASISPSAVTKVLKAWTSAFDKAGAAGAGPVGRFSAPAYKLSHRLIPSVRCRADIAREAIDLQATARGLAFLQHPDEHHDVEDHAVQDISMDKCTQQVGKLASRALQFEILGDSERAAAQLSRIRAACPGGQTVGSRCEGDPDEIACLGRRIRVKAKFLTTPPRDTCGDGVVSAQEQCELDRDCGDGNRCVKCQCVSPVCALVLCGNGTVDPGEECDDGNTNDNDPCQNCKVAVCGDGIICNNRSCTSGRGGTPEQCDPPGPDNVHCFANCLSDCGCQTPP